MGERDSEAAGGGLPLEERRGPECGPGVRGCVACRRWPGPSKSMDINPGHHPPPQGLRPDGPRTAEVEETYMTRRGSGTERHDTPGSAVGKDSERP